MKKHLAAIVCGFGAGVMQVVPVAKSFTCCLIIPFAVFIAIILDRKANNIPDNELTETKKGVTVGIFTGLFAAFFGSFFEIFITFITKNNDIIAAFPQLQDMINSFPFDENMKKDVIDLFQFIIDDIKNHGFSLLYASSVIVNNFIVNTIFGLLGGLISVQIINSRISKMNKM
ncbi:hypothetical protein ACFLTH_12495 [Bacteroidota bacterium]